jgi:hypothetical protein
MGSMIGHPGRIMARDGSRRERHSRGGARALTIGRNAAAGAVRRWRDSHFSPRLRFDPAAAELLLAPHLDDAVFNCWGLLTSTRRVQVVNVFAGVPAPGFVTRWDASAAHGTRTRWPASGLRRTARALALAGRSAVNLDLLEIESRRAPARPGLGRCRQQRDRSGRLAGSRPGRDRRPRGPHDAQNARLRAGPRGHAGAPVRRAALQRAPRMAHWDSGRAPEAHRDVDVFWSDFLGAVPEIGDLRSAEVSRSTTRRRPRSSRRCGHTKRSSRR